MIWRQNVQNFWVRSQNYKSNQITMERIDLISKQSKMSSYVVKHWKLRKTQNYKSNQIRINLHRFEVKTIKMLRYVAKLQKWSNYNELHWFDVKTFKTFELGRKTTKVIKLQWSAMIWYQNNQKCRVTS